MKKIIASSMLIATTLLASNSMAYNIDNKIDCRHYKTPYEAILHGMHDEYFERDMKNILDPTRNHNDYDLKRFCDKTYREFLHDPKVNEFYKNKHHKDHKFYAQPHDQNDQHNMNKNEHNDPHNIHNDAPKDPHSIHNDPKNQKPGNGNSNHPKQDQRRPSKQDHQPDSNQNQPRQHDRR